MTTSPQKIELLAPARNAEIAIEALRHGADAVYIGADGFGARQAAGNSCESIARVVDYAGRFGAKVYVTVNTIIYENELKEVEKLIRRLYQIGVDALIVQDMGILRLDIPPIALHASTQCDTRTVERARFLRDAGFSQIVLPREMSLDEIAEVHRCVDVPLEAFVHGALCVSYSGDCHASAVLKGRSANRGECAQICRLPYDLYDGAGKCVERGRHFLSLRDMNRSESLLAMMQAGISSFKIEGRLKDVGYVKNVVAYYNERLNEIIASNPGDYCRASAGRVSLSFTPSLQKSFNRGFTSYFLRGGDDKVGSIYTPKSLGEPVGEVVRRLPSGAVQARLDMPLANGDGLGFFNARKEFVGFRLNRVEGNMLFPASQVELTAGTRLYRNSDKVMDDTLSHETAKRTVDIEMTLRRSGDRLVLDLRDEMGNAVSVSSLSPLTFDEAKTDQSTRRHEAMSKLGATDYKLAGLDDRLGQVFVPAGELAALRREGVEALSRAARITRRRELRRPENREARYPEAILDYHANVANSAAVEFYRAHGAEIKEMALEVEPPRRGTPVRVMTTRYCLRRELGCCLKHGGSQKLKGPLTLKSGSAQLHLDFDCASCRMTVSVKKIN